MTSYAPRSRGQRAEAVHTLQTEDQAYRSLVQDMATYARERWNENTPEVAAEARRFAELFAEERVKLETTTRNTLIALEEYAAVVDK